MVQNFHMYAVADWKRCYHKSHQISSGDRCSKQIW